MTDQHSQPPSCTPDAAHPQQRSPRPQHGYAPPQHGYPQQGSAPPQAYPVGAFPRPSTGVRHWAWQLLYWMPLPFVPLLVVPAVLLGVRAGAVRNRGVDEANSRAAMNWSLTRLTAVLTTAVLHFGLLFALTNGGTVSGASPQGVVLAITASLLGVAYIGGGIMTLVNVIRGWAAAARGEASRPLFAITLLRAARPATGV